MFSIRVWFVCKLCKGSFQTLDSFIDHKKQKHLLEFQKLKCIVFEERNSDSDQGFIETGTSGSNSFSSSQFNFNTCIDNEIDLLTHGHGTSNNHQNQNGSRINDQTQTPGLQVLEKAESITTLTLVNNADELTEHLTTFPVEIKQEPDPHLYFDDNPHLPRTGTKEAAASFSEFGKPMPMPIPLISNVKLDPSIPDAGADAGEIMNQDQDQDQDPFVDIKTEFSEGPDAAIMDDNQNSLLTSLNPAPELTLTFDPTDKRNSSSSSSFNRSTNKPPLKCPICSKEFAREYTLKFHIESHKSKEEQFRPFACSLCGLTFRASFHLREHFITHSIDTPFKCSQPNCSEQFKRRSGLLKHQKSHSDFRPFPCTVPGCGKFFKEKRAVQLHMSCHTSERPFHCQHDNCYKTFKRNDHLVEHIKAKHTRLKDLPSFICDICSVQCGTKSSLKKHSLVHTEERPFQCGAEGCRADFKRKRNLEQHEKVHAI